MDIEEKYARLRFAITKKCKFTEFQSILTEYGSIIDFFKSGKTHLLKDQALTQHCGRLIDGTLEENFVVYGEASYPPLLANIPSPPLVLFCKGDSSLLNSANLISIVGTRKNSSYGKRVTIDLVKSLAIGEFTFVSGMALGIDTIVHASALSSGAKTIAVLPSSLSQPTPSSNTKLFEEIAAKGVVISEFPEFQPWNKYMYYRRNRIIAGMSLHTVVIEAPLKSGAMITANYAFEYNRELYAIPGNIYSEVSEGTNSLIKQNKAQILTAASDLTTVQTHSNIYSNQAYTKLTGDQYGIINLLNSQELSFDDILKYVSMSDQTLKDCLFDMELDGFVCLNSEGKYRLSN